MPAALVIFVLALLITVLGLFLSPKSLARRIRQERTSAPRGKSATQVAPAPRHARAERWTESEAIIKPVKARTNRQKEQPLAGKGKSEPVRARATRPVMPRATAPSVALPGAIVPRRAASISINPGVNGPIISRKALVPGVAILLLFIFYLLNMSFSHPLLWIPAVFGTTSQSTPVPTATTSPTYTASKSLVRLGQLNASEYRSTQEYNTWAYGACSAAAMTEVINSYGHSYRITDILAVESKIHEITPALGLLEESGIQHTGAQFGFKTSWGHNLSLDQVIAAANRGTPVIVSWPPALYPEGHIVVVRGGNASTVYLADSSIYNRTQLSRAAFLKWWGGFSAIMTPK